MKPALPFAAPHARLLAKLLDTLMLYPINLFIASASDQLTFSAVLAIMMIEAIYYSYFHASHWQATPGKRIVGIKVVDVAGQRLSPRLSLERHLACILPTLPIYSSLDPNVSSMLTLWLIVAWFSPILIYSERAGIHDYLCGTRVVNR